MSSKVTTSTPETTLRQLWKLFFHHHVNAVPVISDKKKLLGIITKEDILKLIYPNYQDLIEDFFSVSDFEEMENRIEELGSKRAKDVMNKRVIFTRTDTPILRALSRMITRRLNQLPVLSQEDILVGIVTKGDIFYALFGKHVPVKIKRLKQTLVSGRRNSTKSVRK